VYEATDKNKSEIVCIFQSCLDDAEDQEFSWRSLEIFTSNTHPVIMKLVGFSLNSSPDVVESCVINLSGNGLFDDALRNEYTRTTTPNATRKSEIIFGIVAGMASLHSRECQLLETVPFD
jgi:hypothetical protein